MDDSKDMVVEKSWGEFRNSSLLRWINMILHTFGWAIVVDITDGKITRAYPARKRYRGFGEQNNTDGYIKVSKYLKEHADELEIESRE